MSILSNHNKKVQDLVLPTRDEEGVGFLGAQVDGGHAGVTAAEPVSKLAAVWTRLRIVLGPMGLVWHTA